MKQTLFWAWQSDAENSVCRGFIKDAAEKALKALVADGEIFDPVRLDHATNEVSGTPEIAGSIFEKIRNAALFLGDVTLVGNIGSKRTPNPNVLTETGFAAGVIGWDRVILVMNRHFGEPEELPFDMRNRRFPLTYDLAPDAPKADIRAALIKDLSAAILEALNAQHDRTTRIISQLTPRCHDWMKRFRREQYIRVPFDPAVTVPSNSETTIEKLLVLGLVESKFVTNTGEVGFFWTYQALLVKERLGYP